MTPLEALNEATQTGWRPKILDDLRALGFVIVPVKADEATIERVARAMNSRAWSDPQHERTLGGISARRWSLDDARAAYERLNMEIRWECRSCGDQFTFGEMIVGQAGATCPVCGSPSTFRVAA